MKYTPYFRESEAIPLDISTPIREYRSTYFPSQSTIDTKEDTSTPVESEVEEVRTSSQPITHIPAPKDIIAPVTYGKIELDPSVDPGKMSGLLDEFRKHGISVRVTSGTRQGATTKQGKTSFHSTGEALDITPINQTYAQLRSQIASKPELVRYMKENGYGILDETTPEMLARTGGTGAHWHIGRDRIATENFRQWFGKNGGVIPKYQNGKQLPDYEDLVKKAETYGRQFYQSNHWKNLSEQEKGKFMEYKVRSGMNNVAQQMIKAATDIITSPKRAIEAVATQVTNEPNDWRSIINPDNGFYKSFGDRSVSKWDPETKVGKISKGVVSTVIDMPTDPLTFVGIGAAKSVPVIANTGKTLDVATRLASKMALNKTNFKAAKTILKSLPQYNPSDIIPSKNKIFGIRRSQIEALDDASKIAINSTEGIEETLRHIPLDYERSLDFYWAPTSDIKIKLKTGKAFSERGSSAFGTYNPNYDDISIRSDYGGVVFVPKERISRTTMHEYGHATSNRLPEVRNFTSIVDGKNTYNGSDELIKEIYPQIEKYIKSERWNIPEEIWAEYFRYRLQGVPKDRTINELSKRITKKNGDALNPLFNKFEEVLSKYVHID